MDKEKYGKDLKALGKYLALKEDDEGLKLYDELLSDLNAQQDEIARYLKGKTILTDEGIKEIVEIFLKGRNIDKYISTDKYNSLRNFINGNTKIEVDIDGISNMQLIRVLSSLDITLGR